MFRYPTLALAVVPALLAASFATTARESQAPSVRGESEVTCEIRPIADGHGTTLQAVLQSAKPLSGTYDFSVAKRGGGGSSTSAQSGEFVAMSGGEEVLGAVTLGLDGGASYSAELMLDWAGGTTSCRAGN
ncbi:curli-like amyloid fiber formation chaperone CsgH [Lutibaculum baratangense]|uniref:CsgH-like domain-containing protein n=1 Tax=Lutibaculum baratangense AMV1 TaxID=631454 RepID=V4RMB0_9HYPH|nr:curli-like amyloid fiber formation chaperone CsgH [Lutibaculum baratangense]ESR26399.1 hypothetical protein N177_0899 [Lutibaculum baratangense AMV1]